MDIGIGGIGFERVYKRVEVASHNVLPRDRYNIGLRERTITIG